MASITSNCKYVVVYTDNKTGLKQTLVIDNNTTQTLPKNITINSVTQFGTGCSIATTCGTLPSTVQAECYAAIFDLSDGDLGGSTPQNWQIVLQGFNFNGNNYDFNSAITVNTGGCDYTSVLLTQILADDFLRNIIYDLCFSCIRLSHGSRYVISFKGISSITTNAYLYGILDGVPVQYPIFLRSNPPSGVDISSVCTCS